MITCKMLLANNVGMKFCNNPATLTDVKTNKPVCASCAAKTKRPTTTL